MKVSATHGPAFTEYPFKNKGLAIDPKVKSDTILVLWDLNKKAKRRFIPQRRTFPAEFANSSIVGKQQTRIIYTAK